MKVPERLAIICTNKKARKNICVVLKLSDDRLFRMGRR